MATLEKRIEVLEQASGTGTDLVMFVHLVSLGAVDAEIQRITQGGRAWERQQDESEQDLKDRAQREANPKANPNNSLLFLCF